MARFYCGCDSSMMSCELYKVSIEDIFTVLCNPNIATKHSPCKLIVTPLIHMTSLMNDPCSTIVGKKSELELSRFSMKFLSKILDNFSSKPVFSFQFTFPH